MVAISLAVGLALGLQHVAAAPSAVLPRANANSKLPVGATWDYPLGFTLTKSNANSSVLFYSTDLENTAESDIRALVAAGKTIACYFSAGSTESYRNDTGSIPKSAIGKTLDGWPDENWLDTRNAQVRQVMANRITKAAARGCQAIDPDNMDAYNNDSGFPLTTSDAIDYFKFLAGKAKAAGLLIGLKNSGDIVGDVLSQADYSINEQCTQYTECPDWKPFIDAGKPVFNVEYTSKNTDKTVSATTLNKVCNTPPKGFSSIVKHMNLDNWRVSCK